MLRHGKDYLASLRDGRRIRLGSELVTDVTTHPAFKNTAQSFARIYDLKRSPQHAEHMSFEEGGQRYSAWFMPPRSKDDLRLRAEAHRRVAEWSCGLLGRSMDHVPSFIAGMSMKPELFDANRKGFGDNVINYLNYLKEGDLFACYLVLTPQTSRGVAGPAKANFTVVGEYEDGIVVSGQKMLGTSAVFSDEAWVGSMIPLGPDQVDEAVTFAVPINAPGVELWVRKSFEQNAHSRVDNYFSSQFDESDAVMIFKDVKVPWERVFCYRDVPLMRDMYFKTPGHMLGNHQSNWRFSEKLKLINGIAHQAADYGGLLGVPAIQQTLGRLAAGEATLLGLLSAQIDQCVELPSGHVHVNNRYLYAALQWCASNYHQIAEEVRLLLGASPFIMPADDSILEQGEAHATFEENWKLPATSASERYRFVKMAWDLLASDFAGRHQQYERFYGGPPHIMDLYSFWNAPWAERRQGVQNILNDMSTPHQALAAE